MPSFWKELNKIHQRLIVVFGIFGFIYLMFTTFRAGVLFPVKQEMRMDSMEGAIINLSNQVSEILYKQDKQHELLIRIEENLWPSKRVARSPRAMEQIQ